MAIKITDDCINCGACEPECPNTAIYEAAFDWKFSEGTSLKGDVKLPSGRIVNADTEQEAVSDEYYFIVTDCCVPDEDNVESEELLLTKQSFMHGV